MRHSRRMKRRMSYQGASEKTKRIDAPNREGACGEWSKSFHLTEGPLSFIDLLYKRPMEMDVMDGGIATNHLPHRGW